MRSKIAATALAGALVLFAWPLDRPTNSARFDAGTPPPNGQIVLASVSPGQCPLDSAPEQGGVIGGMKTAAGVVGSIVSASPIGSLSRTMFGDSDVLGRLTSNITTGGSCPLR